MGRIKDFEMWLESRGLAEWDDLLDKMVHHCDINDPVLLENYRRELDANGEFV